MSIIKCSVRYWLGPCPDVPAVCPQRALDSVFTCLPARKHEGPHFLGDGGDEHLIIIIIIMRWSCEIHAL